MTKRTYCQSEENFPSRVKIFYGEAKKKEKNAKRPAYYFTAVRSFVGNPRLESHFARTRETKTDAG